ncbi:hypothetical protein [Chryseobacterium sp. MP_3.2]|uniref:hypothetical protein n=1 Tax=Chryseobacterium sp. MP_3.2 TaxID=3071712 RepID=UPI002E073B5B|nr:hypothetical protein [Chryseobacterium sp. MP_3.2]
MHSLEIPEISKRFWIPENLGECDKRQYLDAAKLVLMFQMGDITKEEFRILLLYSLMNMEFKKSDLENIQDEKWENIFIASEVLNSFFTIDEAGQMHLVQDYIHNPVKTVPYKLSKFKGPKDSFQGITYGQLEDGVGELNNFIKYGEIESLVKLFAIFYLKNGEKYSKINLEKRIKFFDQLDIRYVYGFYLLFVSFFNYLTKECIIVLDGKELDLRILFSAKEEETTEINPDEPESLGMRATSFQLAESGVFGTLPELRESDAMMVLVRMYDLVLRNRKEDQERTKQEESQKTESHD